MKNNPARALYKSWLAALEAFAHDGDTIALGDPRTGIHKVVDRDKVACIEFGTVSRADRWSSGNTPAYFGQRLFSLKPNGDFKLHYLSTRGFGNGWNRRDLVVKAVPFLHWGYHTREIVWVPKRPGVKIEVSMDWGEARKIRRAYVSERVLGNHGYWNAQTPWLRLKDRETDGHLEFVVAPRGAVGLSGSTYTPEKWEWFAQLREKRHLRDEEEARAEGRSLHMGNLMEDGVDLGWAESVDRLAALLSVSEPARTITPFKRPKEAQHGDHMVPSHQLPEEAVAPH